MRKEVLVPGLTLALSMAAAAGVPVKVGLVTDVGGILRDREEHTKPPDRQDPKRSCEFHCIDLRSLKLNFADRRHNVSNR